MSLEFCQTLVVYYQKRELEVFLDYLIQDYGTWGRVFVVYSSGMVQITLPEFHDIKKFKKKKIYQK